MLLNHLNVLSDCNWTRTHNHLVLKRTVNHLAIWPVWLTGRMFVYELSGCRFESSCSHLNFRFHACFEKGVQATKECEFTLKCVRDMTKAYSKMHSTVKYSQHSSIVWLVWLNGWVFAYELSGCGFKSSCSHFSQGFSFRFCSKKKQDQNNNFYVSQ